ncbi:hypothetical protein NN3_25560 [Nocardia neocaledoniensis NBRC 108232]|uniref:Putative MFS family arabinose efflux permease n=1 Tax=Nocardia neocaledoniensis TaxID=236511 RepID=A0A317N3F5_9NOCA|nr:MFS transporter [Nocardia neocaledoniensis]PWV68807.1 putative MFS family arabinose efflux permease [Nocardia neocaledoniensis]GEM31549.1 hypothetical protein NN3_25560 [Nocardia neocaledoniensis NBRC 108232]
MTSPPSYRALLAPSGVRLLFAGSALGRVSFGMGPIGVVTLLGVTHGAFGVAGVAMGAYAFGSVVSGPARSWWTVRVGHGRAVLTFAVVSGTALVLLPAVADRAGPAWAIVPAAVAGLAVPPFGALLRVGWARRIPPEWVPRAFGLDAVVEESAFVLGPVLAALALWTSGAVEVVVLTGILCLAGGLVMARAAGSARPDRHAEASSLCSVVRRLAWLLVTFAGVGYAIGGLEVGIPAAATEAGRPGAAGLLFALMALASASSALLYGRIVWRRSPRTRFLTVAAVLGTTTAAAGLGAGTLVAVVILVGIGLALGPAVMTGYLLADQLVAGADRTHGAILAGVACNAGAGLGAAASGVTAAAHGAAGAFALCGLVTLVLTAVGGVLGSAAGRPA